MNVVILDTAGRLHVDETMMEELANIQKAIKVDQTIFVVDAMTGQDAVNVAKSFNEQIELDGVILTKMDGDTRGGAALSIRAVTASRFCMLVWVRNSLILSSSIRIVWHQESLVWVIS